MQKTKKTLHIINAVFLVVISILFIRISGYFHLITDRLPFEMGDTARVAMICLLPFGILFTYLHIENILENKFLTIINNKKINQK